MPKLIILGAGTFGLSTALCASEKYDEVLLIDNNDPNSASRSLGRIFRTEYPQPEYHALATQAKAGWKENQAFHECGRVVLHNDDTSTMDRESGWIEARVASLEYLEQAKRRGVMVVTETAVSLIWDGNRCSGVKTDKGEHMGETVLVALGAFTLQFFADEPDIRQRLDAILDVVVLPWICTELSEDMYEELKGRPITVRPGEGEYLPPNKDRLHWVNNARTARVPDKFNLSKVQDVERQLSPATFHLAPYYDETRKLRRKLLPGCEDQRVVGYSYCKDVVSRLQHFLVDKVPGSEGLFIATGGSCHAYKFFPVLGKIILSIILGKESEFSKLWSFKSHESGRQLPVHAEIMPDRDFETWKG